MHTNKGIENKEVERKIKRIKILDELLLAFGRDKIIFKQMDDAKHLTLSFLKEGILDVHETIEGREKRHIPLERLDVKKFAGIKKALIAEVIHNLKEIDISDPKYMEAEVLVIEKEALRGRVQKVTKIKRKEMVIEESKLKDMMKDLILPIKDLQNYDFRYGWLLKESEPSGLLYRIKGKYFLIELSDLEALIKKVFEKYKALARPQ